MTRPAIIIPPALQPLAKRKRWMIWKWERVKGRDGKLKPTKPPYRADAPNCHAKSTDPSTWCDLATAMRVYVQEQCDGVGVALMGSAVGALDLDDCRDKQTGDLHPWALEKIKRSGSYAEVTPSGEGARIIGLAKGGKIHRKLNVPNANGASVELYRRAERFITVTGIQIGDAAKMVKIDALLDQTLAELDKKPQKPPKRDLDKLIKDGCGQDFGGDRSRAVWYVINQLLKQGRATDDIVTILLDRDNGISAHIYDQLRPDEYARQQVEKAQAQFAAWPSQLLKNSNGVPYGNVANVMIALRGDTALSGAFEFDEMMQTQMLMALLPLAPNGQHAGGGPYPRAIRDDDVSQLQEWLQHQALPNVGRVIVHQAVHQRARERSYHPVRDQLDGLANAWDGTRRVDTWLSIYLGAKQNAYTQAVGRMFLIAMIARIQRPGCKLDYMLNSRRRPGRREVESMRHPRRRRLLQRSAARHHQQRLLPAFTWQVADRSERTARLWPRPDRSLQGVYHPPDRALSPALWTRGCTRAAPVRLCWHHQQGAVPP